MFRIIRTNWKSRYSLVTLVALVVVAGVIATAGVFSARAADDPEKSQVKHEQAAEVSGDWFVVEKRSFDLKIVATGELEAKQKVEIKNQVEGRTTIVELIEEGAQVKKGDQLIRLADDEIRERLESTILNVEQGRADLVAAEQNYAIKESAAVSNEESAQVKLDLAELDFKKWQEGTVPQKRRELDLALKKAKRNLDRAERTLDESLQLKEHGFISESEYDDDVIAHIEAENALATAELDIEIYNKYTYIREEKKFKSDVEQARGELERTKSKNISELEQAKSNLDNRKRTLKIREDRLEKSEEQLEYTVINAPQDGLVVYGTSVGSGWHRRDPIVQGKQVHFNETLIVLPDTSQMVAAIKVHEAVIPKVEEGQQVNITIDALPGETIVGKVWQIGVMAESSSWVNPDLREYMVKVDLPEGTNGELKPAMRCTGDILIGRVENALAVPVQSVITEGKTHFVFVPTGGNRVRKQDVKIGRASEAYVEILEGLEENDRILVRAPKPGEIIKK